MCSYVLLYCIVTGHRWRSVKQSRWLKHPNNKDSYNKKLRTPFEKRGMTQLEAIDYQKRLSTKSPAHTSATSTQEDTSQPEDTIRVHCKNGHAPQSEVDKIVQLREKQSDEPTQLMSTHNGLHRVGSILAIRYGDHNGQKILVGRAKAVFDPNPIMYFTKVKPIRVFPEVKLVSVFFQFLPLFSSSFFHMRLGLNRRRGVRIRLWTS